MNAIVIYDDNGKIWQVVFGNEVEPPTGLKYLEVFIPDFAMLTHIDVTDPSNPVPMFQYLPDYNVGKIEQSIAGLEESDIDIDAFIVDHEYRLSMLELA